MPIAGTIHFNARRRAFELIVWRHAVLVPESAEESSETSISPKTHSSGVPLLVARRAQLRRQSWPAGSFVSPGESRFAHINPRQGARRETPITIEPILSSQPASARNMRNCLRCWTRKSRGCPRVPAARGALLPERKFHEDAARLLGCRAARFLSAVNGRERLPFA